MTSEYNSMLVVGVTIIQPVYSSKFSYTNFKCINILFLNIVKCVNINK